MPLRVQDRMQCSAVFSLQVAEPLLQTGTSFGTTVYRNACPRVPAEARVMKDSELNIYRKTHKDVEMDNFDGNK